MNLISVLLVLVPAVLVGLSSTDATAREARHRRSTPPAPIAAPQPAPRESRFYIKGPNAPFQNQVRKLTDPLNANGAK